jgi:hypothetical protein
MVISSSLYAPSLTRFTAATEPSFFDKRSLLKEEPAFHPRTQQNLV